MRPTFSSEWTFSLFSYTGCVGGCDESLNESLSIRPTAPDAATSGGVRQTMAARRSPAHIVTPSSRMGAGLGRGGRNVHTTAQPVLSASSTPQPATPQCCSTASVMCSCPADAVKRKVGKAGPTNGQSASIVVYQECLVLCVFCLYTSIRILDLFIDRLF